MPIYAPNKRINPTIKRRGHTRKTVFASLFLTSMVDMFAILVIFLLQAFSSEGEIIVLPSGIELPKAINTGTLERVALVIISQDEITFEGKAVAKTKNYLNGKQDWEIRPLQEALREFKQNLEAQALANRDVDPATAMDLQKINISADRRLPYEIVRKVLNNVSFEGFPAFSFAVFPASKKKDEAPKE